MSLVTFITADANSFFTVALSVMLLISLLEGITTLFGMGLSSMFETLLPELDFTINSVDTPQGVLSRLLSWINYSKVPALIILICFLTLFSLIGYTLQYTILTLSATLLPKIIAGILSFFLTLPLLNIITSFLIKIMPKDESSALTQESFIGAVATITLGTARYGSPAQAKTSDKYGQTHYFMVEPEHENIEFTQGQTVLLSKLHNSGYTAIENKHNSLKT